MVSQTWLQVATLGAEGRIVFSDIYAFGHTDPHTPSDFIRLSLAGGHQHNLELTAGHFIPTGPCSTPCMSPYHDI